MELPKLERKVYKIQVDSVELEMLEPSLAQLGEITNIGAINKDDPEKAISNITKTLASLLGGYDAPEEEKIAFLEKLSARQITTICEKLTDEISPKVSEETGESHSSSQKEQAGQ